MREGDKLPPIHPGEVLREEFMAPLGLSANKLALALRVPPNTVNDIVRERRGISPETALRLARYFRTSPELWINMQSRYELKLAQTKLGDLIVRDITPRAA